MKIYGILYITIIFAFDTGDCKCDEYIIVLKEVSCAGTHSLNTTKLFDIKWNELTYPYNSTGMYHEINVYKGCVLELECENQSSECTKRKDDTVKPFINKNDTDEIKTKDEPIYDINIIYLNNNSSPKTNNTHTKTVSHCDYAETACVNKNKSSSTNKTDGDINRTRYNGTMKELMITLKRDLNSKIQPIFTGFVSRNVGGDTKYEYLEATVSCKYNENSRCEISSEIHNKSGNSSFKEILDEPSNSINVYMHSEYIRNNTKIKYTGCTKKSDDMEDLLKIQCDAQNFTYDNSLVLYTPIADNTTSKQNESLNLYCHIRKSVTIKAKLHKENLQNGFNIINFTSCHNSINNNDLTDHQKRNITIILENKKEYNIDSTTKKDDDGTTDRFSTSIYITTDSLNNCNQYPLLNITEGKVIDFQTNDIEKEFSKYGSVELKLLSCISPTTFPENKTNEDKEQETKLLIVLNNKGSDSNQLNEELDDLKDSTVIILQCDLNNDTDKDNIAFECETMDLSDYIATNVNYTNNTMQKMYAIGKKENLTIEVKTKENNCSSNTAEIYKCVAKDCNTTELNRCNNVSSINETNNNATNVTDMVSLPIENPDSKRIILIVIASIASFSIALVCAIKKCSNVGEYTPAATREPPDVEDTPF